MVTEWRGLNKTPLLDKIILMIVSVIIASLLVLFYMIGYIPILNKFHRIGYDINLALDDKTTYFQMLKKYGVKYFFVSIGLFIAGIILYLLILAPALFLIALSPLLSIIGIILALLIFMVIVPKLSLHLPSVSTEFKDSVWGISKGNSIRLTFLYFATIVPVNLVYYLLIFFLDYLGSGPVNFLMVGIVTIFFGLFIPCLFATFLGMTLSYLVKISKSEEMTKLPLREIWVLSHSLSTVLLIKVHWWAKPYLALIASITILILILAVVL